MKEDKTTAWLDKDPNVDESFSGTSLDLLNPLKMSQESRLEMAKRGLETILAKGDR